MTNAAHGHWEHKVLKSNELGGSRVDLPNAGAMMKWVLNQIMEA